jgi:hypothetical protein
MNENNEQLLFSTTYSACQSMIFVISNFEKIVQGEASCGFASL